MSLHAVPITRQFEYMDKFDALNKEAFPLEERIPKSQLVQLGEEDFAELLGIYDGEEFIGFFFLLTEADCVYVFFFAIDEKVRSKGYGGKALKMLRDIYPDKKIFIDLEVIDEAAPNNEQRIARRKFYERNGYQTTNYFLSYFDMTFEILNPEGEFDKDTFWSMYQNIVEVLKTTSDSDFDPRLYAKGE